MHPSEIVLTIFEGDCAWSPDGLLFTLTIRHFKCDVIKASQVPRRDAATEAWDTQILSLYLYPAVSPPLCFSSILAMPRNEAYRSGMQESHQR